MGPGDLGSMHMCNFDLEHVNAILGSFGAPFPKLGRKSKTAHRTEKKLGYWQSI